MIKKLRIFYDASTKPPKKQDKIRFLFCPYDEIGNT